MASELILIIGGARSGKSALAERLARGSERALFAAAAEALDDDMARRIAAHRRSRPAHWDTLEEPLDLSGAIAARLQGQGAAYDAVIVDCLTVWVSNMLLRHKGGIPPSSDFEREAVAAAQRLLDARLHGGGRWIVVTNEVGQGVAPPTALGGVYRDALGRVNSLVASQADRVYLMAAGLALDMKALGARHHTEF